MTVVGSDEKSPRYIYWSAGLLLLVSTILCLSISHRELYWEEGRRVMAAREMISSGDYIIPTVSGKPYLNKPPLYPWLTAIAGTFRGEVDAVSVRIPTLLATLLTGAYLVWTGFRLGTMRIGFLAAFFFLLCPMIIRKSSLGETDLLLTFGCSVYALEMLVASSQGIFRPSPGALVRMVLGLAIAFLAKGTAAFPLVVAVLIATALGGESGRWRKIGWWGPPLLALGISFLWIVAVLQRPEGSGVLQKWTEEISRAGSSSEWWRHRWEYAVGVLLGFFPGTLLFLFWNPRKEVVGSSSDPLLRWLIIVIAVPFVICLLWPGVQPRYLLPVLPTLCWLASSVLSNRFNKDQQDSTAIRTTAGFLRCLIVLIGIGGLINLGSLALGYAPLISVPITEASSWFWITAMALFGAFFPVHSMGKVFPGEAWSRIFVILFVWSMMHSLIWMPIRGLQRPGEEIARRIEDHVPEGSTLWHNLPANWNTLGQIRRDLLLFAEADEPRSGDWILTITSEPTNIEEVAQVITLIDGSRAKLGVVSSRFPKEK